jgi:hypothetical protein
MKTFTMLFISAILFFNGNYLFSQNNPIEKLFQKYSSKEGFTSVNISGEMFSLLAKTDENKSSKRKSKSEHSEIDELIKGINGIKILSYSIDSVPKSKRINFFDEVIKSVPLDGYKELMTVSTKSSNVKILIKKEKDIISEFLLIAGESPETTLIWITGRINLNKLSKLSKEVDIKGFDKLEDLDELDGE